MSGNLEKNEMVPKQGDLIWIDAEPHAGHEYGGHNAKDGNNRRPMLVISDEIYNRRTHMIVGFPITSSILAQNMPSATIMKIEDQSIHGYAVFSGLLGYDFQARHGRIVGEVNRNARQKAMMAVRSIFGLLLD